MKNRLLKYGSNFCGIEHANNSTFYLLQLQKKKKELVISQEKECKNLATVFETLGAQKHAFLIINNEQVLSKQVDFVHASEERIVKSAFPNIAFQDFYFEVYQNETTSFVSICRREVLDKIVEQYKQKGISIIDFSLGNIGIKTLVPFLEKPEINTSHATVTIENQKIQNVKKNEGVLQSYQINGLEISNQSILSLAGVISYYSGTNKEKKPFQKTLEKEYQQKRFFNLGIRFALGFLFTVLLINFLVFSQFRNQVADLKTELELNQTYKKQLISLNKVVSKKKKLVESISSAGNSRVIWYVDQISKTVPKTLLLDQMEYQPLVTRSMKQGKPLEFRYDQIEVSGVSRNDADYTQWIAVLEKLDWIEKVSFENYGRGTAKRASFGFIIHIKQTK